MARLKPISALALVAVLFGTVLAADYFLRGGTEKERYLRVPPDPSGRIAIDVGDLETGDARFFRFLNSGNQEVKFFVARDRTGVLQVAFDACELCFKLGRGNRHEGDWITCNKCDKSFRVAEINQGGGGCNPIPLVHRVEGDQLLLREADVLTGWRLFR